MSYHDNTININEKYANVEYHSINVNKNSYDYSFGTMSAIQAYFIFYANYRDKDFPYFDELANVILGDTNDADPMFAYSWIAMRGDHVEEFYEYMITNLNAEAAVAWVKTINDEHNLDIKRHIIRLGLVNEFVSLYHGSIRPTDNIVSYTHKDFYKDLPQEYQIGVIL